MGRGVSTARGAVEVLYFPLPDIDEMRAQRIEDEPELADEIRSWPDEVFYEAQGWAYDDVVDGIRRALSERYPSFVEEDAWSGREDRVVATNGMTDVVVSEYGGLIAVSIASVTDREGAGDFYYAGEIALRESWTRRMAPHIAKVVREAVYLEEYSKVGTFSNGESVYAKAA